MTQEPSSRIIMLAWSWCVPCSIESVFLHANGIPFTHVHLPPETPLGNKVPGLIGHLVWKRFRDPGAAPGEVHSPVFLFLPEYPRILRMDRNEARSFVFGLEPSQVLIQPSFAELVDAVRHLGYEVTASPEEAVLRVMEKVREKGSELGIRFDVPASEGAQVIPESNRVQRSRTFPASSHS
ncbi:MAG: hypothetical protein L0191_09345 [Acidobacteria bacterium]|nr:hypothetical protein [Acidobacteriota bacterium]MCI0655760.1 hypothetical protein [Acidobacteriota bacterium]